MLKKMHYVSHHQHNSLLTADPISTEVISDRSNCACPQEVIVIAIRSYVYHNQKHTFSDVFRRRKKGH